MRRIGFRAELVYIYYLYYIMKKLHGRVDELHKTLKENAATHGVHFNEETLGMMLRGYTPEQLREYIVTTESGEGQAWHLANVLPHLTTIQEDSHRNFSTFKQKHLPEQISAESLKELEFAMLAKLEDDLLEILKQGGLNKKEALKVEGSIMEWFEQEEEETSNKAKE